MTRKTCRTGLPVESLYAGDLSISAEVVKQLPVESLYAGDLSISAEVVKQRGKRRCESDRDLWGRKGPKSPQRRRKLQSIREERQKTSMLATYVQCFSVDLPDH